MPTLPGYDQKVLARLLGKRPGGSGGNVACAASRLGLRTGMVSWVGDDAGGALVLEDLRRFGVDTTHVTVEPDTETNFTTIFLDPSGEKAIVVVPTSFDTLTLNASLMESLRDTRVVYATPYDLDQLAHMAAVVHKAGGLICSDIEPVAGLEHEALLRTLALIDLAFINVDTLDTNDVAQTARELHAAGPEIVVITQGARGALACRAGETVSCPAFSGPVVDTTGAGDCFAAAFLAGYLRQFSLEQSLVYANAAAALSIQAHGARGALPTDAQVRAFLNAHTSDQQP